MGKEQSFETAMKRLDIIVKSLENGDVPLNESIELFNEGVMLANQCNALLEKAEQKVSLLVKDQNGEIKEEPFEKEGKI